MRTKCTKILALLLVFVSAIMIAQIQVSGVVKDADGEPLPGAYVESASGESVETDIDGNYTITANQGEELTFSFIGMDDKVQTVSGNSMNITLGGGDGNEIEQVVITGQGIKRDKKALGYSVATVSGDDLQDKGQVDMARALSSKAPGVNVTASGGTSGSGTNIVIRGYSSITGSNQPLFIVDGVPFNGDTNNGINGNFGDGGAVTTSRFLDLDPNIIESVSVLKGLAASTIYGSAGRNGVILITTKNGKKGFVKKKTEVTVNQAYYINEIASAPDYQNEYGNGFYQGFGYFFSNWGPRFDDVERISQASQYIRTDANGVSYMRHPYSYWTNPSNAAAFPELQDAEYAYKAYDNNRFWDTGSSSVTSVNISGSGENANYNANFGYTEEDGYLPGNGLRRFNLGLGGSARLTNKFTITGTLNLVNTDVKTPPISAGNGSGTFGGPSILSDVFYTPRSIDLMGLPFENPNDGSSVYYRSDNSIQHPLWTAKNVSVTDNTNRVFGSGSISYALADNMNLTYRLGVDQATQKQEYKYNKGGVQDAAYANGYFRTATTVQEIFDHTLLYDVEREINDNLGFSFTGGANAKIEEFDRQGAEYRGQLVFGLFNAGNFTDASAVNSMTGTTIDFYQRQKTLGVFGSATLDYRDYLFLNLQARNDWSSTLEKDNRSIFYPSASLSFIPTAAFDGLKSSTLNYLKLRAGYGTSAGFPTPYNTRNTVTQVANAFVTADGTQISTNEISNFLANADQKPELHEEFEFGVESQMFNNRVILDASAFYKTTRDLITFPSLAPETGYLSTIGNIGEVVNKGIEVSLDLIPIKSENFKWTISNRFSTLRNEVKDTGENDNILIASAGLSGGLGNYAIKGESMGTIMGTTILRDDNGNPIINEQGNYQVGDVGIIGDAMPDYTYAVTNTLNYKGFNFSMAWDYVKGGDIFSQTASSLLQRGLIDVGDRDRTYILDGVQADGTPNTVAIPTTQYFFDNQGTGNNINGAIHELGIWDATTIRLSEVSIGYNLPKHLLENSPFGGISVSLIGNNLWYKAINLPSDSNVDPNTSGQGVGNGQGFDFLTATSSRRIGMSVRLTF